MLPYGRQWIDEDDIKAVSDALRADYITTGPKVDEFERTVADYVGAKYAVAVSSGTAALHIAVLALGIKAGDEVITSPITFAASSNCVLYCGGKPVFADVDDLTHNINPSDIESKVNSNTKAIIPVHFTGQPCDMDKIHSIAKKYNLSVIEDAAHALGAKYRGKMIGSLSDMTVFSFHPIKHITTGEGGMVVTNNEELYNKLKLFRSHGIVRNDLNRPWYYEQLELGYNYRISDIQCALGISQMKKIDKFIKRRKEIVNMYNNAFKNCKDIIIPYQLDGCDSSWHLYIIQLLKKDRDKIFDILRQEGIGVNVNYIPVYKHPYYQKNGYDKVVCSNAENFFSSALSIPIFPKMTNKEVDYVIGKLKSIFE